MNWKIVKIPYLFIFILSVTYLLQSGLNSLAMLNEIDKIADEVRYFAALIGGLGLIGLALFAISGMVIHWLLIRFHNRYRDNWEKAKNDLEIQLKSK